jgi:hypothetical protein
MKGVMKAVTGRKYRSPFAASGTENRHIGTRSGGSVNNNPLRFKTEGIVRFFCLFRFSRGGEPPKRARENVSESILQIRRIPAIIDLKNKNAAACGCCSTRKPVQVLALPTQRRTRTAWIIIRQTAFSRKCRFAFIVLRSAGRKTPLHALCRLRTCTAFLFFARRPGAHSPPGPLR